MSRYEEWRPAPGWLYLEVSNMGRIRSQERSVMRTLNGKQVEQFIPSKVLKPTRSKDGYLYHVLRKDGRKQTISVHRLVALAFVDGYKTGLHVHHKNNNPGDNRPENLEWVTAAQNTQYAWRDGLVVNVPFGSSMWKSALNERDVHLIKRALEKGESASRLAKQFGVSRPTISHIKLGNTWKHVP